MNIELLLLDMDDTLMDSKGKVSKRTIDAVRGAVDMGKTVALASGRMHVSLEPYIDKLNTHGPVVSYNGALIKNSVTGETIYSNFVSIEYAKEILKMAEELEVYCQFYTDKDYFIKEHCKLSDDYHISTGVRGVAIGKSLWEKIKTDPPKLLMIEPDDEKLLEMLNKLNEKYDEVLHITQSKGHYIEIMNKNVNKGGALIRLCDMFKIEKEKCMAIGDGLNDREMLTLAGLGIAVENAAPQLKEIADEICASSDEDGPAQMIEKYVLSK